MQARTVINQCYIVRERIGDDGLCELWRATSVFSATEFLLRFLNPHPDLEGQLQKFQADIHASYAISHPAVADIVDFEQFEGRYFIASAFSGQKTLRALLKEGIGFGLEELCRYILELAQGVDAFHSLNLVYRCFNAENVLFRIAQGRVESVQVQKPGYASLLGLLYESASENWIESWAYVAPEIKRASGSIDQKADVYSLGIHLFRFLTGKLPFPDDAAFVRKEAASLAHVAKALLRRGVPEPLVRIAIRALRPDPSRRYADCVRFIAELRDFTDERRALILRKSGVDPLAAIETLNRAGGRIGASQIVRSLDTADYFRLLSETPAEPQPQGEARSFPFSQFSDPAMVMDIELAESASLDPGDRAEDAYIADARKLVGKEPWAVAEELPTSAPPKVMGEGVESHIGVEAPAPAESDEATKATDVDMLDEADSSTTAPGASSEAGLVIEAARPRKRAPVPDSNKLAWKNGRLSRLALVGDLEEAVKRAKHGRGTFRFIEEPQGPTAAALGRAILRLREEALVLDLRAFPEKADATDLLRMFRRPLAASLGDVRPSTLRLMSKRLAEGGGDAILAASPLGALLYGNDRPEPDPDFLETEEGSRLAAQSILGFGRRSKPLLVLCRGGESVGLSAHRLLMELAELSPFAPVCFVVFFGRGRETPAWHILSKLED
ncbi:MAG TPA: protein kinase [Rectinemataceae bacterium]|nr:protein kinase [Rectinemataceae bacterium]